MLNEDKLVFFFPSQIQSLDGFFDGHFSAGSLKVYAVHD